MNKNIQGDFRICISVPLTTLIFTLLCENSKHSLILRDAEAQITELWEAKLLDSLILINVVPGISEVVRSLGHF